MAHLPLLSRRQMLACAGTLLGSGALAGLAGCAAPSANNEDAATQEAAFSGTFVVGFDQDFPPYGYVGDDGGFTGFDLDLAQEVCRMEGWTYEPKPIAWDLKDTLLSGGQITCIWNGFTREGREEGYAFTDSYMENRQVIVVRAGSDIESLADLSGRNVMTQADSAAYHLLTEDGDQAELGATFAQLQTIGEYNTAFMMLEGQGVDAIAVDYPVAVFNMAGRADAFTILDEPLNSEHFAVGFADTALGQELAATVQADLQKLDEDGTVARLCEKYADQGISYDLWVLPKA